MVGSVRSAFLASLLFASLAIPMAHAECPTPMSDCGVTTPPNPLIPGAGQTNTLELSAHGYTLTATLAMDAGADVRAGAHGTVAVTVYARPDVPAARIQVDFAGSQGLAWDPVGGANFTLFEFQYDPATMDAVEGSFGFTVAADQALIPIGFSVQPSGAAEERKFGVLTMGSAPDDEPSLLARWAVPSLAGLVVGAALSILFLRRKAK